MDCAEINKVEDLKPLTSLRFFAAMMIVVLHSLLFWPWFTGAPSALTSGVSFFFVLSGFILTHVYSVKGVASYWGFVRDRVSRIWPMHMFALLLLIIFVRNDVATYDGVGLFSKSSQFVVDVFLLQSLTPFEIIIFSWNSVSWSISTELFFYLAFPFLLMNINSTWRLKMVSAAFISVGYAFLIFTLLNEQTSGKGLITPSSAIHANPIFRAFEFCLGICSWVIWRKYIKKLKLSFFVWSIIEIAVVVNVAVWVLFFHKALLAFFDDASPLKLIFRILGSAWVYAALIIVCASGRGVIGKILNNKALIFLGEISFAVYMLHMILMKFFAFSLAPDYQVGPVVFFMILIMLSAGCHFAIEKPMQKLLRTNERVNKKLVANTL
ncbi:acyltransferase family protein [Pseudomonas frederiksbergensis]|uniref:Acyltransferase 3 domain-containing protein n=1 Tax=Pseudomonas frederiksbergensis TaxID=104087 RepID=A0A6L5C3K0_9PSED|nr:acyltransferase [Pseudomonas frederiksbergensis]KAF2394742.1 hypothetical protein FX983_02724 [Pseudomonas frederiksbergensis]